MPLGEKTREGASGSLRRKSGDRPDARQGRFRLRRESRRAFLHSGFDLLLQRLLLAATFFAGEKIFQQFVNRFSVNLLICYFCTV